jgi:hypothetical protein
MCEAIMTITVAKEFDLEDRLDGVMENVEASAIMGTAGASSAYALKVHSKQRNLWQNATEEGSWAKFVLLFIFGFVSLWVADVRSTENA